jgi:hypothetical protein
MYHSAVRITRGETNCLAVLKRPVLGISSAQAAEPAGFMLEQLNRKRVLHQKEIAHAIQRKFGNAFVYQNRNGNLAIHESVLKAFHSYTKRSAVWVRPQRYWRLRKKGDAPGRLQNL